MVLSLLFLPLSVTWADTRMYHCEVGLQGGCGYYVGDATPHIFMNPLEVFGGQFRYKFDKRWALQAKAQRQRITFRDSDNRLYYNPLWHVDVTAEFNFFRFGQREYDVRVKPVTPYIFIGLGVSVYNSQASPWDVDKYPMVGANALRAGAYIPLGIGVKWKFADRWQLQAAWQHQVYLADNIEGVVEWNNPNAQNGSNILNNDLTSTLTLGIVFEFAKGKKVCRHCLY